MEKARVFISCGQKDKSREVKIANNIAQLLRKKGFEPYVAKQVQSLGALTSDIFDYLEKCEYFLFVDFKREQLLHTDGSAGGIRGSLFSHQELGIAAFLQKECLIFKESGINLEGVQSFVLSNPLEFEDQDDLLTKIDDLVSSCWEHKWRNELTLSIADPVYEDALLDLRNDSRWFHILVQNRHRTKHASNCFAFIRDIVCGPKSYSKRKNVQACWSGYSSPSVAILPKDHREIDVVWLFLKAEMPCLRFNVFATSSYYAPPPIEKPGKYEFTFEVVSDNFPAARARFELDWDGSAEGIGLREVEGAEAVPVGGSNS